MNLISAQKTVHSWHEMLKPQIITRVPFVKLLLKQREEIVSRYRLTPYKQPKTSAQPGSFVQMNTHEFEHVGGVDFMRVSHESDGCGVSVHIAGDHGGR